MTFETLVENAPLVVKTKLEQLKFLKERPDYHPEPSTFHHIRIVTNRLIKMGASINLILAGLFHDICKFDCVKQNPITGYPTSPNHGKLASDLITVHAGIQTFILGFGGEWPIVAEICANHMKIQQYKHMKPAKKEKMEQLRVFNDLQIFTKCDDMLNPDYDLSDVLPKQIVSQPTEGGIVYYCRFWKDKQNEDFDVNGQLTEQEFHCYYKTGKYKVNNNIDDMFIGDLK